MHLPDDAGEDELVVSARTLGGLAHPVRLRLLTLLRQLGPSDLHPLATRLGLSTAAAERHLTDLAGRGLVTRTGQRWAPTHRSTSYVADDLGQADARDAEDFLRALAGLYADEMSRAVDEWPGQPPEWRSATKFADLRLRLTPAEMLRLRQDLYATISRYRLDAAEPGTPAPAGSAVVSIQVQLFRTPGDREA
jgi:DNA-binding transcriptional ArsR family regulator